MNNEITLRTNKGEYHPGETVYGAVYLNICRPSEGCGIQITFKGSERCQYNYECDGKKSFDRETILVDFSNISLFSQDDFFQFGSYVFPFSFQLPKEITGTTELEGEDEGSSWKVKVAYWIQAWVMGSDAVKETQPIIIFQCQSKELQENNAGTAKTTTFENKRFGFGNKAVHVTIKLVENYRNSGLNSQLRIIITNDSKVVVTGFDIKLKRHFKFAFSKNDCDLDNLTPAMTVVGETVEVLPETGLHIIKTLSGCSNSMIAGIMSGGLDNLQVPLTEKTPDGSTVNLPPSADGKCFRIRYGLDVSVSFSNKHTETLSLVIPGVLPRLNLQWLSWMAPDWAFGCETKLSSSPFSVAEHILCE